MLMIAAEPREFDGLLAYCSRIRRQDWPVRWARAAELNGASLTLVANGAGAVQARRAAEAAASRGTWTALCSLGFCGALVSGLKVGDIFVASNVAAGHSSFRAEKPVSTRAHTSGTLASVNRVAQTAAEKQALRETGAAAVEMEAAGAAAGANALGIPFYCVRAVTDLADESFHFDFNSALKPDGRFDTIRIISAAFERPLVLIPELLRLRNRCRVAARRLGEFLADCRF